MRQQLISKPEPASAPVSKEDLERLREMASDFDCLIDEDFQLLAGITTAIGKS
jgi:hypothetical protein